MIGHPDINRELVFSRQAALRQEAHARRLARSKFPETDGASQQRLPFVGRLADWLRLSEPTFACSEPECLAARQ